MDDGAPMAETEGYRYGGDLVVKAAKRSTKPGGAAPAKQQGIETRSLKEANRRAAARVYVKACEKIGEPVPQNVRDLAAGP